MDLLAECSDSSDDDDVQEPLDKKSKNDVGVAVKVASTATISSRTVDVVDASCEATSSLKRKRPGPHGPSQDVPKASVWKFPFDDWKSMKVFSKPVTSFTLDKSGTRMICGGRCGSLKLFDFAGGRAKGCHVVKELEPDPGKSISCLAYSKDSSKFAVACVSSTPMVFDRNGNAVITCIKGDPFIKDMSHTKGHIAPVTGLSWHPLHCDQFTTSSLDGSLRIWDLNGTCKFGNLLCHQVIKPRDARGRRVGVSACTYQPQSGNMIGATCIDGSIQIWRTKRTGKYDRPQMSLYNAHRCEENSIGHHGPLCLRFATSRSYLVTRGGSASDGTIKVWDLRKFTTPLRTYSNINSPSGSENVDFLIGDRYLLAPVPSDHTKQRTGSIQVFDTHSNVSEPIQVVRVGSRSDPVAPTCAEWHDSLGQVFVSRSDGVVQAYLDPLKAKGGGFVFPLSGKSE